MPRETVLADLRRLSRRELVLTLAELSEPERQKVLSLLSRPEPAEPMPFRTLAGLSPWLLKAIGRVEAGVNSNSPPVTPATSASLSRALEQLAAAAPAAMSPVRKQRPAVARLLGRRFQRGKAA